MSKKKQTICEKEGHNYLVVKSWSEDRMSKASVTSYRPAVVVFKVLVICLKCADIKIATIENIQDS